MSEALEHSRISGTFTNWNYTSVLKAGRLSKRSDCQIKTKLAHIRVSVFKPGR